MKSNADKKRKQAEFKVGDMVLVRLQPYRQHSVSLRKHQKLSMRYFGPFKVLAKVGLVAYKLDLPSHAKIHPVFHIAQLKEFKGGSDEPYIPLPLTTADIGPILVPYDVLDCRMIMQANKLVPQVLIHGVMTVMLRSNGKISRRSRTTILFTTLRTRLSLKGEALL
jgi:hypothetical protein